MNVNFVIIFGTLGMPELLLIVTLVVWVAMLIWVYRDATRRGMNAMLWVVIVFFLHLLGLVVYLVARGTGTSTRV
jgi:hypothetical protein